MKLTLKIKLLPDDTQAKSLSDTIKEANAACNAISDIAFEKKIYNQFKIHKECYYSIRDKFNLSAQMVARCIGKVADAYKLDRKVKRTFRINGSIAYDSRILSYKGNTVSIWTVKGRLKIPFICHRPDWLPYIKGEADLVFKKGKFFILQTVEIPEEPIKDMEEFLGVDMGITDIAVTSDGKNYSSDKLTAYREKRQRVRSSLQSKGTKSSKRCLQRLSGREKTTATIINHTISRAIIKQAIEQNKGIAIEDLTGIRFNSQRRNKAFRTKLGKWNFAQLRSFLAYKATLNGVKLVVVPPQYTSKTCHKCFHIGERKSKVFTCKNCNSVFDADFNGAKNISLLGDAVDHPESSTMCCALVHP